ncbi:MAG: tRNA-uridine aminocarboxypropyltransferase [Polaromonas sp.]|nr:tRNA-uridine aminocarboxypropyltransferase [Polaromonas sp.]
MPAAATPHAVSRLRAARLARSSKPFLARGGPRGERCAGCRLLPSHCLCALRPLLTVRAGVCLLMADIEPLKPSNTGWLVPDVVADTFAFGWARTEVDPALLALLADPQWQPYLVFPGEFVDSARVVTEVRPTEAQVQFPAGPPQGELAPSGGSDPRSGGAWGPSTRRPLFVLLDATWPEARKMFRKSPYLNSLPVLSLQSEQLSSYKLRRSQRDEHFCTSEVAALCLALAGEVHAAEVLEAYLDVFTDHYLKAKQQQPVDNEDAAHQRLRALGKG